jgi:hypothetical protein
MKVEVNGTLPPQTARRHPVAGADGSESFVALLAALINGANTQVKSAELVGQIPPTAQGTELELVVGELLALPRIIAPEQQEIPAPAVLDEALFAALLQVEQASTESGESLIQVVGSEESKQSSELAQELLASIEAARSEKHIPTTLVMDSESVVSIHQDLSTLPKNMVERLDNPEVAVPLEGNNEALVSKQVLLIEVPAGQSSEQGKQSAEETQVLREPPAAKAVATSAAATSTAATSEAPPSRMEEAPVERVGAQPAVLREMPRVESLPELSTPSASNLRAAVVSYVNAPGRAELVLNLTPPDYGQVVVRAQAAGNGQTVITLIVENAAVRAALLPQLPPVSANVVLELYTREEYAEADLRGRQEGQQRRQNEEQGNNSRRRNESEVEFVV